MTMTTVPRRAQKRRGVVSALLERMTFPLFALFLISLVSNLLMLTGPLFMLQVYDRVLASRSLPTLVALTLLVCVLYAFYAFIEWVRSRMAIRFAGTIDEALSPDLFRAAVRLRLMPAGMGEADPVRDLDSLRQFASGPGPLALFDLPWLPVYLAIVFLFHPMLGWLATGGALVITTLLVINELMSRQPSEELTRATTLRQLRTDDARLNAEPVLAMGMLEAVTNRWSAAARAMVGAQHRAADWTSFYSSITKAFRFLLQSAVLAVGALLVIEGEITAGLMIAASIVTSRALAPVEQVVAQWRGFLSARQALKRIYAVLERFSVPSRVLQLPMPTESLSVRQLATGPGAQQRPLVGGITFSLRAGEALGVLGLSGSGKTSLARAIVGVWPVLQGEVRLDGSELFHYDREQLGTAIGYLPQVVDLFDGTVAENISRFRPHAPSEAVLRAAALARTHELITALPEGYDTRLGERGAVLSAGQRQRIGLARALYGDPFLIVLDEPNSNLDFEGDTALTASLVAAKQRGAIVIIVAHRPSAIAAADKILFLQNGRQTAFGPKDEVLRSITQPPAVISGGRAHG
jgi:ATP-binding cassette subfamily C protein PrsD